MMASRSPGLRVLGMVSGFDKKVLQHTKRMRKPTALRLYVQISGVQLFANPRANESKYFENCGLEWSSKGWVPPCRPQR